jgi:hypothetical protein
VEAATGFYEALAGTSLTLLGVLGLTSLLSAAGDNAAVWRVSFAVGGLVGFVESVRYLGRVT